MKLRSRTRIVTSPCLQFRLALRWDSFAFGGLEQVVFRSRRSLFAYGPAMRKSGQLEWLRSTWPAAVVEGWPGAKGIEVLEAQGWRRRRFRLSLADGLSVSQPCRTGWNTSGLFTAMVKAADQQAPSPTPGRKVHTPSHCWWILAIGVVANHSR